MKKARILLIIAIWTIVLPYLGFPSFWKNLLFILTGLAVAYVAYIIYKENKPKESVSKKVFDNFSENSKEQYTDMHVSSDNE